MKSIKHISKHPNRTEINSEGFNKSQYKMNQLRRFQTVKIEKKSVKNIQRNPNRKRNQLRTFPTHPSRN